MAADSLEYWNDPDYWDRPDERVDPASDPFLAFARNEDALAQMEREGMPHEYLVGVRAAMDAGLVAYREDLVALKDSLPPGEREQKWRLLVPELEGWGDGSWLDACLP